MSDNGGKVFKRTKTKSNAPLRGGKTELFEGGTRVVGYIQGPGIPKNVSFDGMMHMVDWLPTLMSAAGENSARGLDGLSIWNSIVRGTFK